MKKQNKSVLIFTPHPDDHISCGGALLKLAKKGYEIYEVLFTNGETGGQIGKIDVDKNELIQIRKDEFDKASNIIGTTKVFRLNIPTNDISYTKDIFFNLIEIIREVRPNLAILPHPDDYHRDHKEVGIISLDVLTRSSNSFALHLGERYRVPVALYCRGLNRLNRVDFMVDISEEFTTLQKIVEVYSSQVTPRLKQYTEALPSASGYYMRTQYAEEYEIPLNYPIFPDEVLSDLKS